MQVSYDRFQAESGWNIMTLLGNEHPERVEHPDSAWKRTSRHCLGKVIKKLHDTYQCRMYGRKLLMIGREDARNM